MGESCSAVLFAAIVLLNMCMRTIPACDAAIMHQQRSLMEYQLMAKQLTERLATTTELSGECDYHCITFYMK